MQTRRDAGATTGGDYTRRFPLVHGFSQGAVTALRAAERYQAGQPEMDLNRLLVSLNSRPPDIGRSLFTEGMVLRAPTGRTQQEILFDPAQLEVVEALVKPLALEAPLTPFLLGRWVSDALLLSAGH
jgi:hypothetical protein